MLNKSPLLVSLLITLTILYSAVALAETETFPPLWPGVKYSDDIPTFKNVLGYKVGERIASYHDTLDYFDALVNAAPDRVKLVEYARSWEGRKLFYAVVAKPKYIASLDDFANDMQALADPRKTNAAQANALKDRLPSAVWLQYSVHGNEISGTDAAMQVAYHLLAASDDEVVNTILENTIVFIDPLQNPDGRERFVSRYYATVGMQHSGDRLSAEHNEPWPRGRSNHYLFDLNRDWLAMTQPETQGKISAINKFKPLVIVDVHEMGGDLSYYFAPAARPFNPYMTKNQIANMDTIGRNHAKHFDKFGFNYFTREIFDAFYPGYGDSWPTFYGASASTYEVGSARGLAFNRRNGETLTFWDTIQQQFVASLSTAEGAAKTREKLLTDFYQYQVSAIETGKKNDERVYILPNEKNRDGTHRLATLMARHGVEVRQASESFKACGTNYKAGSFFIDTAQPMGRFVSTTFTQQVDMAEDFLKEQESRRARNLNDQIYDVTGWSLPLMFNVKSNACDKAVRADSTLVSSEQILPGKVINPQASVAFIVAWGDMAAGRFLTSALRQGITLKSADEAFVLEGNKAYPAGSLIIEKRRNNKELAKTLAKIAAQTGALVEGVNSSWVTDGPSFGSPRTVTMKAPKVAMAWDYPVSSLSAGNTRFVIERQLGYPVTAIRTNILASADLSDYQVIILPEGKYDKAMGKSGAANLKSWVKDGGVLITLGSANRFASDVNNGLLDIKREYAFRDKKAQAKGSSGKKEQDKDGKANIVPGEVFKKQQDLSNAIIDTKTSPDNVSGVLANIEVNQEHWLTAGVERSLVAVAYGKDIYTPIKLDAGKNLAWFAGPDELLASGYLWQENKAQMAYKPYLIYQSMGKGMVIGYTQSPTMRAYLEGLNVLLTNSIFRAVAHTK